MPLTLNAKHWIDRTALVGGKAVEVQIRSSALPVSFNDLGGVSVGRFAGALFSAASRV
jgi:hypothetical protein